MNTIVIELCAEDRVRLDRILDALERGGIPPEHYTDYGYRANGVEYATEEEAAETQHPVENPFPAPVPEAVKPDAPVVKMEDVQKKVVSLSAAGKKAEVRDIVKAYAERVSGIPEDKLAEVLAKLNALEG